MMSFYPSGDELVKPASTINAFILAGHSTYAPLDTGNIVDDIKGVGSVDNNFLHRNVTKILSHSEIPTIPAAISTNLQDHIDIVNTDIKDFQESHKFNIMKQYEDSQMESSQSFFSFSAFPEMSVDSKNEISFLHTKDENLQQTDVVQSDGFASFASFCDAFQQPPIQLDKVENLSITIQNVETEINGTESSSTFIKDTFPTSFSPSNSMKIGMSASFDDNEESLHENPTNSVSGFTVNFSSAELSREGVNDLAISPDENKTSSGEFSAFDNDKSENGDHSNTDNNKMGDFGNFAMFETDDSAIVNFDATYYNDQKDIDPYVESINWGLSRINTDTITDANTDTALVESTEILSENIMFDVQSIEKCVETNASLQLDEIVQQTNDKLEDNTGFKLVETENDKQEPNLINSDTETQINAADDQFDDEIIIEFDSSLLQLGQTK